MFEKTFVMHFIFSKLKKRKKSECNVLQATNAQKRWISIFCKFKELKKRGFNCLQEKKTHTKYIPWFFASLKQLRKYDFNFFKLKKFKKHELNSLVSLTKLKKHV